MSDEECPIDGFDCPYQDKEPGLVYEEIKTLHIDNINTMKDIIIMKKHLNDIKKLLRDIKCKLKSLGA